MDTNTENIKKSENIIATNSSQTAIFLNNVSKDYKLGKQTVKALRGINLAIKQGELITITGASGSGKSTLLQIIGCLDQPTSGSVVIESKETTNLRDSQLSQLRQNTIGFVFQSFYLQPFLQLSDNIAVPAMFTAKKKNLIDAKVTWLLQKVGLEEYANRLPKELSGGQIQRAAIARALINNPRIILADEPTGNLDSETGAKVEGLLFDYNKQKGVTLIVVTHDADLAKKCDYQIIIKDGRVEKSTVPEEKKHGR